MPVNEQIDVTRFAVVATRLKVLRLGRDVAAREHVKDGGDLVEGSEEQLFADLARCFSPGQ